MLSLIHILYDRTESAYLNDCSKANLYMIRYADVLLDYAEAVNLQRGPTAEAEMCIRDSQ